MSDMHDMLAEPFRRLMTDDRFAAVPKVIETPKESKDDPKDLVTLDRMNLGKLRAFAGEVLDQVKHPALNEYLDTIVSDRLHKNF